ncbi:hypothetical protein CsSME_00005108 [Camellia sinensis var. sinensis]
MPTLSFSPNKQKANKNASISHVRRLKSENLRRQAYIFLMDSRVFFALSLCLLSFFPDLAHSSAHRWFGDKNTYIYIYIHKSLSYISLNLY